MFACEASLCAGYRSVILRNGYNEELELSRLLVHVDTRNAKVHISFDYVYVGFLFKHPAL